MINISAISQNLVNIGKLVVKDGSSIVLKGNIINNGTITTNNSTFIFSNSANQEISGGNPISFYNLSINKNKSDLIIKQNISISNNLTLNSGNIDLDNYNIDLGTTGSIIYETETNKIKVGDPNNNMGTITVTRTINTVTALNPGNIGVEITTNKNLGTITITRGHKRQQGTGTYSSNYSIARYYKIPNIGEITATNKYTFHYWNSELDVINNPNENNLIFYQQVSDGTNTWNTALGSNIDSSSNTVITNDNPYDTWIKNRSISYNNLITLGSQETPLPVELINFSAKWKDSNKTEALIEWETLSEQNNNYFNILRSYDTQNWTIIGKINGAGNSNTVLNYSFIDDKISKNIVYYKLEQVDFNGNTKLSNINSLKRTNNNIDILIYPNPSNGLVYINTNNMNINYNIEISDVYGRILKDENIKILDNNSFDISEFPKGMYLIRIYYNNNYKIFKLQKK